jgi:hypothetical protein
MSRILANKVLAYLEVVKKRERQVKSALVKPGLKRELD